MAFNLQFPTQNAEASQLRLVPGEMLFVLGANGTGKSSLMHHIAQQNRGVTRKISAHRQTWMNSDALDMTSSTKVQTEQNIQIEDRQHKSRYRDSYAAQRASMTIYELIDAENVRARRIAALVDDGDLDAAAEAAEKAAPITVINELLQQSNIPITISIHENERVIASKEHGLPYSAAELSDGERNALLIAGSVLTAPPNMLLIIDEPERHLHRSIISPLLSHLFEKRADCGFVVSTHDQDLPLKIPRARSLLLRSCSFNGQVVRAWDADELPADTAVDDVLKRDLLGARRKIVFVEGIESSLDKLLYSIIFPMVSVIPKGSCHDVERAVVGGRAGERFHWLRAFGIVDGDGYTSEQMQEKLERGIYALPFYSVEAIYFHPKVVRRIATRQAGVSGEDASDLAARALKAGVAAVRSHTKRLGENAVKKSVRRQIMDQIPNDDDLLHGQPITVKNDVKEVLSQRVHELDAAVQNCNWEAILTKCPVRKSGALAAISSTLGFREIRAYENAVRHLVANDNGVLSIIRGLFGDLFEKLRG